MNENIHDLKYMYTNEPNHSVFFHSNIPEIKMQRIKDINHKFEGPMRLDLNAKSSNDFIAVTASESELNMLSHKT